MPEQPPCDCTRVPAGFALDCQLINDVWRMLGGEPGPATEPSLPTAPSAFVLPQPLKLELVRRCELEDPDLRPYLWDCDD